MMETVCTYTMTAAPMLRCRSDIVMIDVVTGFSHMHDSGTGGVSRENLGLHQVFVYVL